MSVAAPDMRGPTRDASGMTTYDLHSELQQDLRDDPGHARGADKAALLPVEKRLIGFSLGIGLFLLAALVIVNHFFPVSA
jgi:hypothetical protein